MGIVKPGLCHCPVYLYTANCSQTPLLRWIRAAASPDAEFNHIERTTGAKRVIIVFGLFSF